MSDERMHANSDLYAGPSCYPLVAQFSILALIVAFVTLCPAAQIKEQIASQLQPNSMPEAIYVADFALDTAAVQEDSGILGTHGLLQGKLGERLGPLHRHASPQAKARELVDLLADSLTRDLVDYQLPARRIFSDEPNSKKGWVITGEFL